MFKTLSLLLHSNIFFVIRSIEVLLFRGVSFLQALPSLSAIHLLPWAIFLVTEESGIHFSGVAMHLIISQCQVLECVYVGDLLQLVSISLHHMEYYRLDVLSFDELEKLQTCRA